MKNDLNLVANNLVFSGIGQVVAKANALNDSSLIRLEIGDTDFSAPPLLYRTGSLPLSGPAANVSEPRRALQIP